MIKVKFAYNEPGLGDFETDGDLTADEIIKEIETTYPEYVDIEIIEWEDKLDG